MQLEMLFQIKICQSLQNQGGHFRDFRGVTDLDYLGLFGRLFDPSFSSWITPFSTGGACRTRTWLGSFIEAALNHHLLEQVLAGEQGNSRN